MPQKEHNHKTVVISYSNNADNIDQKYTPSESDHKALALTAVNYGKSFDKNLNFTDKSIFDVEEILDWYSTDLKKSKPTEKQVWAMSCIFGSYIGETLRKKYFKKYEWRVQENDWLAVLYFNKRFISPISKTYKRLTNGPEDSVVSFYDACVNRLKEKSYGF